MSAILCGKRAFFEDIESASSSSPQPYKKFRCSSATSPVRFTYSPPSYQSPVDQLKALFPDMGIQILEKAFEESGYELDSAIKSLNELNLGYGTCNTGLAAEEYENVAKGATPNGDNSVPSKEPQLQNNFPSDGAEWVDLLVNEMVGSNSIDDAKSRAARVLESLEKSITARASSEVAESFHKENLMLKEQVEALMKHNVILKRAVAIQHERQKEYEEKNQEVVQMKQLMAQYQEQLRTLEVNNYALTLHLHQAQQSNNSIPGRFHPDIF